MRPTFQYNLCLWIFVFIPWTLSDSDILTNPTDVSTVKQCLRHRFHCNEGHQASCELYNAQCTTDDQATVRPEPNPNRPGYPPDIVNCILLNTKCFNGCSYCCAQIFRLGCNKYIFPVVENTTSAPVVESVIHHDAPPSLEDINANITWSDAKQEFLEEVELPDGLNVSLHTEQEFEYVHSKKQEINRLIIESVIEKLGLNLTKLGNDTFFQEIEFLKNISDPSPLFGGDIFLTEAQADEILHSFMPKKPENNLDHLNSDFRVRRKRKVHADPYKKWPRTIPYTFDRAAGNDRATTKAVSQAIQFWGENTCLNFATMNASHDDNYLVFDKKPGCSSYQGMRGGPQPIHVGTSCERFGIMTHEIGHALGFWHEHARPDRDKFVEILWENIVRGRYENFYKCDDSTECVTHNIPYDYGSVMHYGAGSFINTFFAYSIYPRDPIYIATIGGREQGPTFYDVKQANMHYCADKCTIGLNTTASCSNNGYPHPKECSKCICPEPFIGDLCEEIKRGFPVDCGGLRRVTDNWQNISSPNYPDNFESGQACSWILETEPQNHVIARFAGDSFNFIGSDLPFCYASYVEVRFKSDLANTGPKLCGPYLPRSTVESHTNQMIIIMRNYDPTLTSSGFLMEFKAVKRVDICFIRSTNQSVLNHYRYKTYLHYMRQWDGTEDGCKLLCTGSPRCRAINFDMRRRARRCYLLDMSCAVSPTLCKDIKNVHYWENICYEAPKPCGLTEWASWSDCSKTCGIGHQTRSREIVSAPEEGGTPCTSYLFNESKLCKTQSCPHSLTDPCITIPSSFTLSMRLWGNVEDGSAPWYWAHQVRGSSRHDMDIKNDAELQHIRFSRRFAETHGFGDAKNDTAVMATTYYLPISRNQPEMVIRFKYHMRESGTELKLCLDDPECNCNSNDESCLWYERNEFSGTIQESESGSWLKWRPCQTNPKNSEKKWDCSKHSKTFANIPSGFHTLYFVASPLNQYTFVGLDVIDFVQANDHSKTCNLQEKQNEMDLCFPTVENKLMTKLQNILNVRPQNATFEGCHEACFSDQNCQSFSYFANIARPQCQFYSAKCSREPTSCTNNPQAEYWERAC